MCLFTRQQKMTVLRISRWNTLTLPFKWYACVWECVCAINQCPLTGGSGISQVIFSGLECGAETKAQVKWTAVDCLPAETHMSRTSALRTRTFRSVLGLYVNSWVTPRELWDTFKESSEGKDTVCIFWCFVAEIWSEMHHKHKITLTITWTLQTGAALAQQTSNVHIRQQRHHVYIKSDSYKYISLTSIHTLACISISYSMFGWVCTWFNEGILINCYIVFRK